MFNIQRMCGTKNKVSTLPNDSEHCKIYREKFSFNVILTNKQKNNIKSDPLATAYSIRTKVNSEQKKKTPPLFITVSSKNKKNKSFSSSKHQTMCN